MSDDYLINISENVMESKLPITILDHAKKNKEPGLLMEFMKKFFELFFELSNEELYLIIQLQDSILDFQYKILEKYMRKLLEMKNH